MNKAVPLQLYIAQNRSKYSSQKHGMPGGSIVYLTTHPEDGVSNVPHYHENSHLSFILCGGAIDKRDRTEAERTFLETMFFHAGERHSTIYQAFPVKSITIEFDGNFFAKNGIDEAELEIASNKDPFMRLSMMRIYSEFLSMDEYTIGSVEMLLSGLAGERKLYLKEKPSWLGRVNELLHDNWDAEITLDEMAIVADVHPKTISKYFPKYFGCTLGEYRRRLKIERSLSLIKTSDHSLTEIAHQCDFFDQSHFTRTFREVTGFLPKQFQKL